MWVPTDDVLRWTIFLACLALIILVPLVAFRTPARINKVVKTLEEIRDK